MFICRPTGRVQVAIIANSQLPIHNWQLADGGKGDWLSHATATTASRDPRQETFNDRPPQLRGRAALALALALALVLMH